MNDTAQTALSDLIAAWCTDEQAGRVAIVAGTGSEPFVEAIVNLPSRFAGLLTNQKIADRAVAYANEQLVNPPQMRTSRRIDRELDQIKQRESSKIVAVPFRLVALFLVNEVDRLSQKIESVFDIPGDKDRLLRYLIMGLRTEVEELCHVSKTRLILNDPKGDCLHFTNSSADLIAPEEFVAGAADMLSNPVPPIVWSKEYERQLTLKALVLKSFDPVVLRQMMHLESFETVQRRCEADWRTEMQTLAEKGETEETREAGDIGLDALEQSLAIGGGAFGAV